MRRIGLLIIVFLLISCVSKHTPDIPTLDDNSNIFLQKADFLDLKKYERYEKYEKEFALGGELFFVIF